MQCPRCGKKIKDNMKFCPYCDYHLMEQAHHGIIKPLAIGGGLIMILLFVAGLFASYVPTSTTSPYYTTTAGGTLGCSPVPCTYVANGNFTFLFHHINGSLDSWSFPLTTYNDWVSAPRVSPIVPLKFSNGTTLYSYDYRGLVTPGFFTNVVPYLTANHTAGQFLAEVQNINSQMVNYSTVFENSSVYPAQLIAEGQGDCKDKGAMMASLLEAGNQQAGYGMNVSLVSVDADNLTYPKTANHLILYIKFANGTGEYVDTTHVLEAYPPDVVINGWNFPLICNATSCQQTPSCSGAYCSAVGYSTGSDTSYETCTNSSDVVGADHSCHPQCQRYYEYCNTGYSCTGSGNGQCT